MASAAQEIPRETWTPYFDELSKFLGTVKATVEVVGRDIGDQFPAEDMVLTALTYDHKDDVFVIGLDAPGGPREEMEHLVDHPRRILVAPGGEKVEMVVDITDDEEHQTIVRVERPPALPD